MSATTAAARRTIEIRERKAVERRAERDPVVQAVLARFPGAVVEEVRQPEWQREGWHPARTRR